MTSRLNKHFALPNRFAALAVAGLVALAVAPVSGPGNASARSAASGFAPGLNRIKEDRGPIYRHGCLMGHARVRSGPCRFADRESAKKLVLLGDSHAMQWGSGLIAMARQRGWQVVALTRASCTAALVRVDPVCDEWRRNSLERIRKMNPGIVVVASAANDDLYLVDGNGGTLSRSGSEPHLIDGMTRTLRRLKRWSGETVLIRDQAVTPFGVTSCLRQNPVHSCGFHPHRSASTSYDVQAARRVAGVRVIDPMRVLCPGGWCRPVGNGALIYRNRSHLGSTFVETLSGWLGRRIPDPWRASLLV